jgi:hypothetical protein
MGIRLSISFIIEKIVNFIPTGHVRSSDPEGRFTQGWAALPVVRATGRANLE